MPDVVASAKVLSTLDEAPGQGAEVITPHDTDDMGPFRGLWVGGAGAVSILFVNDTAAVTISAVPVGTLLPFAFKRILTASTATLMIGIK